MSRQFFVFGIYSLQHIFANPQTRGSDPFQLIFPKMTKCIFHTYGPSGTVQNHDALCILPINVLNEKIYFMAWFLLLGLCIFTVIHHVIATIIILTPQLRKNILAWYMKKDRKDLHR